MKFVSAASILLLALPSAFSQTRRNGKRRNLNSLKSCKSDKKSGCYETVDFELVPDVEHPSSISFPGAPPFGGPPGHDNYPPGHDNHDQLLHGSWVHLEDEHGHSLTGLLHAGTVTEWDGTRPVKCTAIAEYDSLERRKLNVEDHDCLIVDKVVHSGSKRLVTKGSVHLCNAQLDPHDGHLKKDPHGSHWSASSHAATIWSYASSDSAFEVLINEQEIPHGQYAIALQDLNVMNKGKVGHKERHIDGYYAQYEGDHTGHNAQHDGDHTGHNDNYRPQPKVDLAGTVFMNRGVINGQELSSHYTVKCHIMEAEIDLDSYTTRRGLEADYRPPPVRVEKAICEIDICTEGEFSFVENDCIYVRYSGPFGMEFDSMRVGEEYNMMPLLPNYVGAVTGGTGIYRGATGVAVVKPSADLNPIVHLAYIPSDLVHYDFGDIVDESSWIN